MKSVRRRLILLHRIPSVTRRMIYKLEQFDDSLLSLFSFTPSEISQFFSISIKEATLIYQQIRNVEIKSILNEDEKLCHIVTKYGKEYPPLLKNIHDAPLVLYALGDLSLVHHSPSISVIGTRKPTLDAPRKIRHIIGPLLDKDWLIVSGLAYGIDSLAHQLTLQYKRKTISILGSGFYHIYPKQNISLFKQIVKKGLVLTEYPPNTPPKRHHFPERNRIISGITKATLVIEATEKSGTLITVDQALEQGKDVYAVPGAPFIPETVGCHKMIQDGAKLVRCAEDILEEWKYSREGFI